MLHTTTLDDVDYTRNSNQMFTSHLQFYVIIQASLVYRKILLCIPRPSTFLSSITSYVNKCLNKTLSWNMFPPKNKLLICLLNFFPGKHSNTSDRSWELSLPLLSNLLNFRRVISVHWFHKGESRMYASFCA